MSFPEGPETEKATYDDSHDAVDAPPTDGLFAAVTRKLERFAETWSRDYVEMRVEARTGRKGE